MSFGLVIGIAQTNVTTTTLKKFPMIKEALASNNFLSLIYTTVPKLLAIVSIMVWILDSGRTRHVSGDRTRFPDLKDYENFCRTANGE